MTAPSTGSAGNLTGDGVDSFGYDTENHLLSASALGNTIAYTYDPLGASKTVNSTLAAYVDAGDEEIAEYDGSGNLLARYVYGADASAPVATITVSGSSSTTAFDHKDGLGSIVALSDGATGDMTDSYAYDPYGESASLTGNAFRFAGMRLDAESGLYYDRARYYAPALGRFLQTDPIGTNGGINLYAYVNNDPIDAIDPSGLAAEQLQQGIAYVGTELQSSLNTPQGVAFVNDVVKYGNGAQEIGEKTALVGATGTIAGAATADPALAAAGGILVVSGGVTATVGTAVSAVGAGLQSLQRNKLTPVANWFVGAIKPGIEAP